MDGGKRDYYICIEHGGLKKIETLKKGEEKW
jgi:hypothetical protein